MFSDHDSRAAVAMILEQVTVQEAESRTELELCRSTLAADQHVRPH